MEGSSESYLMIYPSTNPLGGGNILNGVVVLNDVVDLAKRRKEECLLFKVDFEKTCDLISWNFLVYLMERMSFSIRNESSG